MLGNLLKKYSNTGLKPTPAIMQTDTDLFTAQNDIEIDMHNDNALSPQAQARRERVLAMLNVNPSIKRAMIDCHDSDPLNVILTIAIRSIGTVELMLPKASFDGMALLIKLDELQQTH